MLRSLALFAAFAAASAEVSAQVGCAKGTYFWGTFQAKHYCVKCPAGTDSAGCTNCAKDASQRRQEPRPAGQAYRVNYLYKST